MPVEPATLPSHICLSVAAGTTGPDDVQEACTLAIQGGYCGVIVNPCFTSDAVRALHTASGIRCEATVSFPLGCDLPAVKLYASEQSVLRGCSGILLAVNAGLVLAGADDAVQRDLELVHANTSAPMGVWVDAALLSDEQLTKTVQIAVQSGAASVVCCGSSEKELAPSQVAAIVDATSRQAHLRIAGPVRGSDQMLSLLDAGADEIVLDLAQARQLLLGPSQPDHG